MTLTLNLSPELEAYLIRVADQQGLSVEAIALELLANSILAARQKQAEVVDMLQSWIDDDQQDTGEYLIQTLDEYRLSDRKLFPLEMKGITW